MSGINDEKLKLMEDEMNRFEAEIALPVLPPPPPPPAVAPRPVIGSNTYTQVQRRLEEQQTLPPAVPGPEFPGCPPMGYPPMMPPSVPTFPGIPPPPPPPPPLLIPHQVQRGPPIRHPMRGVGMGPAGPMMGGPPPPGFMGPPNMTRPGPPFMGPPGPAPGPQVMPMERLPGPLPPTPSQIPAIVSATPKLYLPKPTTKAELEAEEQRKGNKKKGIMEKTPMLPSEMSRARDMAEKVKASTVMVSVGPGTQQSTNTDDSPATGRKKEKKNKKMIRMAGGQIWEDNSLLEWEDDDFRIFCGDLGNDVTDEILTRAFSKYQSFMKAKVVRDKRSNKTKGFGFVSFKDPQDFIKAMKEMNGGKTCPVTLCAMAISPVGMEEEDRF
ncbi:hypothetical protein ANN_12806 [Periplaneta americana]|uniref:RNA-binding protein 42 n=1 Tax=Periplaneta americana TaxID=6978 RepID=A0ABQ8TI52_PERAM|nr:hypothetical protein ANN_12806 [Periplaneta americana]